MADLKTASSAVPSVLVAQQLPSTETSQYQAVTGTTVKIASATLVNTTGSAVTVSLSVVKSGGTAGAANRVISGLSLGAAGTSTSTLDLGELCWLGEGDFISAVAGSASAVTLILTGVVFSSSGSGGSPSGIQDDAIGTGGRVVTSGTVTGTNAIGTGNNRYLIAALAVAHGGIVPYSTYTTLTMTANSVSMTPLVSIDMNFGGGGASGSVHLFGLANPTSNSTQTLQANVVKAGTNFNLVLASMSLSGVSGTIGSTNSSAPTTTGTLSQGISSATGHRPVFACAAVNPQQDFNLRQRYFNGFASGANTSNYLMFADYPGAGTVTATTGDTDTNASVVVDLIPA